VIDYVTSISLLLFLFLKDWKLIFKKIESRIKNLLEFVFKSWVMFLPQLFHNSNNFFLISTIEYLRPRCRKRNLMVDHKILRNDLYTHFSQQPHNKLMWLVIFYYFFTKRKQNKTKNNNKILSATSVCCGTVMRNKCRDHFSF
jgi:hypothetical protein